MSSIWNRQGGLAHRGQSSFFFKKAPHLSITHTLELRMTLRNILLALVTMFTLTSGAQGTTTANEARRTFEKAYDLVFGPQGCSLRYDVNLVGVYKTAGTIGYKGKKNKFIDSRVDSWCDGTTMYTVFRKRKVIEIKDPTSDKRDKYSSKFKFTLDDFKEAAKSAGLVQGRYKRILEQVQDALAGFKKRAKANDVPKKLVQEVEKNLIKF